MIKQKYVRQDGYSGANQYGPYGEGGSSGAPKQVSSLPAPKGEHAEKAHAALTAAGFVHHGTEGSTHVYTHPGTGLVAHSGPPSEVKNLKKRYGKQAASVAAQPHIIRLQGPKGPAGTIHTATASGSGLEDDLKRSVRIASQP